MAAKVWFITGCSSGFGSELANEALGRGDKVIATARNVGKLEALKSAGAAVLEFDVTWPWDQIQAKTAEAIAIYGQVDYLINNAGYVHMGTVEETTSEETMQQYNTNVFGLINTCKAFIPHFRQQRSGVIANISSIGAWGGWASTSLYCGTKWAVTGITESLALELADFGIKVCCVEPGYFRSQLLSSDNRRGSSERRVPAYVGTAAEQTEQFMQAYNGKQPGDIKKAAKVMVDVLSQKGGKEVPLRLALGSDAYDFIKKKCDDTVTLLDEWKSVTTTTDHDDVKRS